MQEINSMGLCAPWTDHENKQISTKMKTEQTILRCSAKILQVINTMGLGAPWGDAYLHNCKLE